MRKWGLGKEEAADGEEVEEKNRWGQSEGGEGENGKGAKQLKRKEKKENALLI